jgi:hypothetical protein
MKLKKLFRLLFFMPVLAWADTTIDPAHPYAWSANTGWLNARPSEADGAVIGQAYCSGYFWSANCGWISLGAGSPANGWHYANDSVSDWGVNHDGEGRLTGYAYGANIGWLTFEQTHGQPRVDLRTGELSGCIWGANIGWLSLANAQAFVRTERLDAGPDTDADGIPDAYEYARAGNLTTLHGGGHDADLDGSPDTAEALADTDPLDDGDCFAITAFSSDAAGDRLEWRSRPTRLYRVEATNALPSAPGGTWADVAGGLIGPPAVSPAVAEIGGGGQPRRFYRIRALVPLSE